MNASIFVLVDALGWEWIKDHPFLNKSAPYRRPLDSVLGFSTAAIPSILTGKFPEEHGRLSLFHFAKERSPFESLKWLCGMPPGMVENRYVRYGIKRLARRLNHFSGYFQLYGVPLRYLPKLDICEKRNIYSPNGITGSTSIFDVLEQRGTPYRVYCYHDGPDWQLIASAEADLRAGAAKFYFLYLAELDAYLHLHADDAAGVAGVINWYAQALEHLLEVARGTYARADIHVFGDHGMAPTKREVDIESRLSAMPIVAPDDYLYLLDSTMARFWFFSDRARDLVRSELGAGLPGKWLDRAELEKLRAWFPDRRYGEEIFLLDEGVVISPSHMGRRAPAGMHGFHPSAAWSKSAFVSSIDYGDSLHRITDIFGVMQMHA
ncbi:MAG TPA: alkaline phosphatase family protein [Candidatus Binataceae bacterium]|nr:alkaline phosphatase family protein [Candidatus Binataceae bacterium]